MKTTRIDNKKVRLFNKYSNPSKSGKSSKSKQKKEHLTKQQIKKLMKIEFKLTYNAHIFNAFMNIWHTKVNDTQVITKDTFITKLFKNPDGFFRDITL